MKKNAVVLLSGGLDSTTCLAYAMSQGFSCYCISFDYGQKHRTELAFASKIAQLYGAKDHHIFKLDLGVMGGSALTDDAIAVPTTGLTSEIPVTYVPARNITFLSIGLAYAEVKNASDIFIGVSAVDYSNYPDCRPDFITSFEKTANLATKAGVESGLIRIHTPIIKLSKAETILLGTKLGVDYSKTVSCYQLNGEGLACGVCDSCRLRKKGFLDAKVEDPTPYV